MKNGYFINKIPYQSTWIEKNIENMLKSKSYNLGSPITVIDQELEVFEREAKINSSIIYYSKDFEDIRLRNSYIKLFEPATKDSNKILFSKFQSDFHNESITNEKVGIFLKDAENSYYSIGIKNTIINSLYVESEESIPSFLKMLRSYIKGHTLKKKIPDYYEDIEAFLSITLNHGRGFTQNFQTLLPYMIFLKNDMLKNKKRLTESQFLFLLIFESALEKIIQPL